MWFKIRKKIFYEFLTGQNFRICMWSKMWIKIRKKIFMEFLTVQIHVYLCGAKCAQNSEKNLKYNKYLSERSEQQYIRYKQIK